MSQYDFKLTDFERIFRKGYRIIIATSLTALIFSYLIVKSKPHIYRATSVIKYDTQNVLSNLGSDAAMMAYDYLDNISKIADDITSYPVLLKTAQRMNLIDNSINSDIRNSNDSINTTIQSFTSQISTETNTSSNTISIIINSRDPVKARDLANAIAYSFKEFSLERKKSQVLKTKKFIQAQLDRIQSELFEVETEMIAFEERQRLPSLNATTKRIISRSDQIEENIQDLTNQLTIIAQQREHIASSRTTTLRESSSTETSRKLIWLSEFIDDDPGLTQLNNRLINQQIERDNQLTSYKPDHPVIETLSRSIEETIIRLLNELEKKYSVLQQKKQNLIRHQQQIDDEMKDIPKNEIEYLRLKRRHNVKEEIYTMFSKRLQEINIAEAGILDDLSIIALAKIPPKPVSDELFTAIGVGFFIGLIIGILFIIIKELLDTSIGTIEDVEQSMKLPVIAVIPQLYQQKKKLGFLSRDKDVKLLQNSLVTHFNPGEFSAEAFKVLRTNIDFYCIEKQYQTFLFTSSSAGEGKSQTAANLSIAFSQQGKKTLLIEANLRRPSLESCFGLPANPGISDILIEKISWEKCVHTVTDLALGTMQLKDIMMTPGLQNLYFIPHGHSTTNPAELLSSTRMGQLLKIFREEFDILFIDAPPVLPVADSIVLSKQVDGVILIYKVGTIPRKTFMLCKERLDAVHANIIGVVLNCLRPETAGSSYSKFGMKAYEKHFVKKQAYDKNQ